MYEGTVGRDKKKVGLIKPREIFIMGAEARILRMHNNIEILVSTNEINVLKRISLWLNKTIKYLEERKK